MRLNKKVALGTFSALAAIAVPMTAVISCGKKDEGKVMTIDPKSEESQKEFDGWLKKHLKDNKLDEKLTLKFKDKKLVIEKGSTLEEVQAKIGKFFQE